MKERSRKRYGSDIMPFKSRIKIPKKTQGDIKRWLKYMDKGDYDKAEQINLKKIRPKLGAGTLPYAPTQAEINNPKKFMKIVRCSMALRDKQPKKCGARGYPREEGCYNPWSVCRKSVK